MSGIQRIEAERHRQIHVEGWLPERDEVIYPNGELAAAAQCYDLGSDQGWPWHPSWFKPSPGNRARDLEKAGALYLAERDRLDSAGDKAGARAMLRKAKEMAGRIDALTK